MIYSSLKIDLQPIPKRRIYHWSRGDWTAIYEKARYSCSFLLQAILSIHQLINYGVNSRISACPFWIVYPQDVLVINLTPG